MAHEITQRADGVAEAAFAIEPAWHGLGTVVDHAMTSEEALRLAQLDWDVIQRPVAVGTPKVVETPEGEVDSYGWTPYEGNVANVRSDTGKVLGLVTEKYKIVQNREAFAFCDALVENEEVKFETAFSLNGGDKVILTARLPGVDTVVDGDESLRYILMSLSHDGSSAIRFGATSVRVVCANTYGLALQRDGKTVKELLIRHTGDVKDSLDEARKILGLARDSFAVYTDEARQLAERELSREEWLLFLDTICPEIPKHDPDYTDRRAKAISETRSAIEKNFRNERQSLPGIEGSAWAAFNAVTEHIDHLPRRGANRTRKAEARFNVTQWGPGRDQKDRAFETLKRLVAV